MANTYPSLRVWSSAQGQASVAACSNVCLSAVVGVGLTQVQACAVDVPRRSGLSVHRRVRSDENLRVGAGCHARPS